VIEVRITPLGDDDYTIEPQKLPLPDTHPYAPLLNPLYFNKKREEEKKAAAIMQDESEDVEMKDQ